MARYDFGLNDEEFGSLTPGEFNALCKRRNIKIRYERYANAITASAIYNCNCPDRDTPLVTAFDFVRDEKDTEKREKLLKAKRFVKDTLGGLPFGIERAKFLEMRFKVIADLVASGYDDAEQIVDECFPTLNPKENE
jgi:hypothetical protein